MRSTTLIAILATAMLVPAGGAFQAPATLAEPELWIVGFHDMPELQPGDDYQGAEVVAVNAVLGFATVETDTFDVFSLRVALDDNVRYLETDVSDHQLTFTPDDFYWSHASNWGVKKIGAEAAWDRTLGSTSVKDGHVDSGIVATHEDLSGSRFLQGHDYYYGDGTPEDESGCNWHGSHTSGTVAATINNAKGFAGMAQITVLPVKIFGSSGCFAASNTNIANALQYVGDQGSTLSSNSWGGGSFSTAIHDAITYSTNLGVIFVASSGNGYCSNCVGNPWKPQAANTIIVTATDSNDAGAAFNSKGPEVDVSAPGVYVGSAGGPGSSYYIMDGTSMAAPHVAGLVGLLKTLNPSWTRQQVTDRITSTAVDLGTPGHDTTFGWGRINADAATAGGPPPAPACSDGVDNDGDGLIDYPADPGCTSASDDDEYNAPPAANELHTHSLDIWKSGSRRYFKVWAYDDTEAAESGVSVSVTVTHNADTHSSSATGTTGSDGTVTFSWRHGSGSYTVCVTNMVKSGHTWSSAAGHASAGNCHTEST